VFSIKTLPAAAGVVSGAVRNSDVVFGRSTLFYVPPAQPAAHGCSCVGGCDWVVVVLSGALQLVQVLGQIGQTFLETLALARILDNGVGLAGGLARVTGQHLPMVEDALGEGLATGVGAQIGGEAERLVDGQVCLNHEHGSSHNLVLLEHICRHIHQTPTHSSEHQATFFGSA